MKRFYKTQREVAEVINYLVDSYWANETTEEMLTSSIWNLHIDNQGKVSKAYAFTTVLKQQYVKRRLDVVDKILNVNETSSMKRD